MKYVDVAPNIACYNANSAPVACNLLDIATTEVPSVTRLQHRGLGSGQAVSTES